MGIEIRRGEMKPTARNIAKYANDRMDNGSMKNNNISISLPKLNRNTLKALQDNYNFTEVREEHILGYVHFER